MTSDTVALNIRYLLISLGVGILVKYSGGLISPENAEQIITPVVGLLIAAGTAWWGNYVRKGTKTVPIKTAERTDVPTVSPLTGSIEPPTKFHG